jgi:hypothetical protein
MLEEIKRVICLLPYTDNHLPEIFSGLCSSILLPVFWQKSFAKCATWILPALVVAGIVTIVGSLISHAVVRRAGAILTLIFSATLFISSTKHGINSDFAAAMMCIIAIWNYFKSGFETSIRSMTK